MFLLICSAVLCSYPPSHSSQALWQLASAPFRQVGLMSLSLVMWMLCCTCWRCGCYAS